MKPNKKEIFKDFLDNHDVLIVDKNPSSRTRLQKIMVDLGAKRHMIHSASSLAEAEGFISEKNIGIILSDYFISGGSGFELFKLIREKNPTRKTCNILVTSNISQTTVAKAAEEDVDSFVIKPYTVESIQENLLTTIVNKVKPSQYMVTIEEGKALMLARKFDEAMTKLQFALTLHPKPALALFYQGQAAYLRSLTEEAQGSYKKGLALNNIHFKCLVGLFDILMEDQKFDDAYQVVKKIAKYFPSNEERLAQIIRLAIQTNNYQDMGNYYEIFTNLEERTTGMVNYIGAGLYVSGKYFLKSKQTNQALVYFENVAISCSEYIKFSRAIISTLVEHKMADDAEKFLKRFSPGTKDQPDYLISDFLVSMVKNPDAAKVVKQGLDLYNRNIRDFQCMVGLVKAMEKCNYKSEKIEQFRQEISQLWPGKLTA